MIASLLGMVTGGVLGVGLMTLIISTFAFKHEVPLHRASKTVLAGTTTAIFLSLFGAGFNPLFQGMYVVGGILIWPLVYRHYKRNWTDDDPNDDGHIFR